MRNEPVLYANKLKRNLNVPDKKKKKKGPNQAYRFDTRGLMLQIFVFFVFGLFVWTCAQRKKKRIDGRKF